MFEIISDLLIDALDIFSDLKKESKAKNIILTIGCILVIVFFGLAMWLNN